MHGDDDQIVPIAITSLVSSKIVKGADLELLITLDDPEGAPEQDTFNHLQPNALHDLRQHSSRTNGQIALTTGK